MDVTLDRVSVDLGATRVVTDLSLTCPSGTLLGLLGPNGSGKSSLLRTVYRALRPRAGAVLIGGDDTWRALRAPEAARRTAALAQHSGDGLELTVAETVMTGRLPHQRAWAGDTAADRACVADALARVGMAGHGDRGMSTLSGGERQRVLLARALAQQPRVLVLDEPTNHLDVASQLALLDLVRSLGLTVLAALHDLNLAAQYCDRLAVLSSGRLVATGTPDDVLTPALVADVFGVRADRQVHPATGRLQLALSALPSPDPAAAAAVPLPEGPS